ncbi:hypothetical protein EPUS_08209 [Endocarpon pusillum Z07020]|uniref:BUB protein kinase n=1 Tax=Endocarpon pusillum (strain Z07020 / HMAS-L-300199) TaxID=1263415 RepID=U1G849_ENDPU|nr:uncharacterized protein EPUS_08209 [Endocarpon pusillum Z07020]ERF68143.1 hypothetical protein EPUS_08209 [Endocarpon pusillum Z07020]
MSVSEDLINFDLIETHKENIQQLPSGRSARQLVNILSPTPTGKLQSPSLDDTKTLNDAIRHEYEHEVQNIAESDDPLDVFDRYVKWTLNAYPSAQATPQSQLLPLLERATKTFLASSHYKNDPRYLKLWLHYIRWFSDAPRETFAYLSRHNIAEGLALFYEEFATWLESAGRWSQAEQVYKLGIEREARPAERLMRKFGQFQQRFAARPQDPNEPTSPALPTVRPALAAKIDPFASTPRSNDPQAAQRVGSGTSSRPAKAKMAVFSDSGNATPPATAPPVEGWQSIGSLHERKKENAMAAKPWVGETLKAGKRAGTTEKMTIFKDQTLRIQETNQAYTAPNPPPPVMNSKTGRPERVFVNLEAVYPNSANPADEMSFDELRAIHRGWADKDWREESKRALQAISGNTQRSPPSLSNAVMDKLSKELEKKACIDENESSQQSTPTTNSQNQSQEVRPAKQRRMKIREVKQETQTIKTNLASPTGPKIRRKLTAEPTMTFHSKAATNDVYDLFNQPLKCEAPKEDTQSAGESDIDDDGYSTAGESTGTGMISGAVSESGNEDTSVSVRTTMTGDEETSNGTVNTAETGGEWTEFSTSKHIPPQNLTGHQGSDEAPLIQHVDNTFSNMAVEHAHPEEELSTPIEPEVQVVETTANTPFVPIPPEDYNPAPLRTFRDPSNVAQSRLPFMTPIVEKTESSLAANTVYQKGEQDYFTARTPSRSSSSKIDSPSKIGVDRLLVSSPFAENASPHRSGGRARSPTQLDFPVSPSPKSKRASRSVLEEQEDDLSSPRKKLQITRGHGSPTKIKVKVTTTPSSPTTADHEDGFIKAAIPTQTTNPATEKSPIITDLQCNPTEPSIRNQILANIQPPLSSYTGFFNHPDHTFGRYTQLQKRRRRGNLEAIKAESPPSQAIWEFHIIRTIHRRLLNKNNNNNNSSSQDECRALDSIITAHELHAFADEAYLVLDFCPTGTLLDLINLVRADNKRAGKAAADAAGLDEVLAMFFTVELLRTVESLHGAGILHGDLKGDNCLIRLPCNFSTAKQSLDLGAYTADGSNGWAGIPSIWLPSVSDFLLTYSSAGFSFHAGAKGGHLK